jgi:MoaA/NifB/PqqE/SkfB family radical SAM enzyme
MKSPVTHESGKQTVPPEAPMTSQPPADGRGRSSARRLVSAIAWAGPKLGRIGPLRRALANHWEKKLRAGSKASIEAGLKPPGVIQDMTEMGISILKLVERSLAGGRLSKASVNRLLNVLVGDSLVNKGVKSAKDRFEARFGVRPPGFLLVSPTKTCNLRCEGCYADSGPSKEKLEWPIIDRMVREAREHWGAVFMVISGGEPLAYQDEGKTVLDLAEQHPESFFLMYTNGTLIDDKVARRLSKLGNLTPAISVEGLREPTDKRRGAGVFDKIVSAMELLRREKVLFGVSMTATRGNADALLSDEVVNFYFEEMGALYGWLFHYMPIGRAPTLKLVPTPEQRFKMWQRAQQLVCERHLFIADFWNSGAAAQGCQSAGHPGGYLAVDWNGAVSPCVFVPYSPMNIHDVYAQGKTLTDVWQHPFFARMRTWQWDYSNKRKYTKGSWHGNWLMPCPIRDHYEEFHKMLMEFKPEPVDENAKAAMFDLEYQQGMIDYDRAIAKLFEPVWKSKYMGEQK